MTKIFLFVLWLVITISFALGISLPIATISKFYLIKNEFSLLSSLVALLSHGGMNNIVIFLIVFLFSILFPLFKIITTFIQLIHYNEIWQNKYTKLVETIGHFSMIDIFIIALMVLLLKLKIVVQVKIHVGFYWFSLSIICSLLLSLLIKNNRQRLAAKSK